MNQRIENKIEKYLVNLYYTYKQFFFASSIYSYLSVGSDFALIIIGAVLTIGSSASPLPVSVTITLSILVSAISLARAFWNPSGKSSKFHQVGRKYQHLYEDMQDFKDLKLPEMDEEMATDEFETMKDQKQDLDEDAPEISNFWYKLMKKWKGDNLLDENEITDRELESIS